MRKDQDGVLPKSGRHRALNIIYFFDAHKTRSFHLSLARVYVLAFCLTLLCSWSLGSFYYVAQSFEEKDVLNDRLHAALATIFEYQSRYDGVYELAYPEIQVKKELVSLPAPSAAAGSPRDKSSATSEPTSIQPPAIVSDSPQDLSALTQENLHTHSTTPQWPIAIEDLNIHRDQDELELSFAIRNRLSPSRSEGYIWAVASLIDGKGQPTYLASPRGLTVDAQGLVENPSKYANWYSIRYYKAKNFYFTLPANWQGKITHFDIGMMDKGGKVSTYHVALSKPTTAGSGSATTPLVPQSDRLNSQAGESESSPRGKVVSKAQNSHVKSN